MPFKDKEKKNEYQRFWRKNNPEKVRVYTERVKPYHREYYQKHKEKIDTINREWGRKHSEARKQHWRKWYLNHKEGRQKRGREYYAKHPDKMKVKYRRWREKKNKIIRELLGNKCKVCGNSKHKLYCHEIYGRKHKIWEMIIHPENFVLLCYGCHKGIHWCMKELGFSFEDILKNRMNLNGSLK